MRESVPQAIASDRAETASRGAPQRWAQTETALKRGVVMVRCEQGAASQRADRAAESAVPQRRRDGTQATAAG